MESNRRWLARSGTLAGLLLAIFAVAPNSGQDNRNREPVREVDQLVLAEPVHETTLKDQTSAKRLPIKTDTPNRLAGGRNPTGSGSSATTRTKASGKMQSTKPRDVAATLRGT